MTSPARGGPDTDLADRGLLTALAIQYDKAGIRDRAVRLAHVSRFVGRPVASSAELTAAEARQLRKHLQGCACVAGGRCGVPSPCDPAGSGRYCPPRMCWCGACPWWTPAPPVNYAAAIERLAEQTRAGAR